MFKQSLLRYNLNKKGDRKMYHTLLTGSTDAGVVQFQMHYLDEHGSTAYVVNYPSEIKGFQKEKVFDDYESSRKFILDYVGSRRLELADETYYELIKKGL